MLSQDEISERVRQLVSKGMSRHGAIREVGKVVREERDAQIEEIRSRMILVEGEELDQLEQELSPLSGGRHEISIRGESKIEERGSVEKSREDTLQRLCDLIDENTRVQRLNQELLREILLILGSTREISVDSSILAQSSDLLAALKKERDIIAIETGKMIYQVVTNETLQSIVERRPRTMSEMGKIRGMGSIRLAESGSRFLKIVSGFSSR